MRQQLIARVGLTSALAGAFVIAGACSDPGPTAPVSTRGLNFAFTAPAPVPGQVTVCKVGSSASFTATATNTSIGTPTPSFNLVDGQCSTIWTAENVPFGGGPKFTITATETGATPGFQLTGITVSSAKCPRCAEPAPAADITAGTTTVKLDGDDYGYVITYHNTLIPATGCTRTIGYWKNHAGGVGRNPDVVSPLLPVLLGSPGGPRTVSVATATTAKQILNMNFAGGHPSNGITKLYAQLLAGRLNIKSGASASDIAGTIVAADAFLATNNQSSWQSLSGANKQTVLNWMETLDRYNNGLLGAAHCR